MSKDKWILWVGVFFWGVNMSAQSYISGSVVDEKGRPVVFAQVFIEETFEGGATDESGEFRFTTTAKNPAALIVRAQGFKGWRQLLALDKDTLNLQIDLVPSDYQLNAVVISAGAFEASDEKKGTILKPLDIVQNPGAEGDIFGALRTLPGVSQLGDETGIFVRGGEASETQTVIDGTIVRSPFFSQVPNIPARGRFDPFLFTGVMFSTGGYSAEYGQALSSVLLLDTQGIPGQSTTSLGLNFAGMDVSHTKVWNEKTALIGNIGYSYLQPLFSIVPQNTSWRTEPRGSNASWAFRHKGKNGLWKSYFQYQRGRIGINTNDLEQPGNTVPFNNRNQNLYWNNSYKGIIGTKWKIQLGAALNRDVDENEFGTLDFGTRTTQAQGKITIGRSLGNKVLLKFGSDFWRMEEEFSFENQSWRIADTYVANYVEADMNLSQKFALRMGMRGEYSSILGRGNVAPRTSLAYKVGKESQVSLAYGQFYQTPRNEFLYEPPSLNFEQATHYIVNYQWMGEGYTFRSEAYIKEYDQLIKEDIEQIYDNEGNGSAMGIDLFWRDTRTIENLDYWVTYSYVRARRNYLDFPEEAVPTFVTPHSLNVVANYNVRLWRLGASYAYGSGRTFENPLATDFLSDRTPAYHQLRLSSSYLMSIFGNFSVLYASIGNPFGWDQVFGYRFSSDGQLSEAIVPASRRSYFLGIFISFE